MVTKTSRDQMVEELHRIIDQLPEDELRTICMMITLTTAPIDDEPTTVEEDRASDEAWHEYLRGEVVSAENAKRRRL